MTKKAKKVYKLTLTKMQLAALQAFEGDGPAAARAAGYKSPKAWPHLMTAPHFCAAVEMKMNTVIQASGIKLGEQVTVTRNAIINRLDQLSQTSEIDSVKVGALRVLADIFQLTPKGKNDADLFSGWTEEELDTYRLTGALPPRFGLRADNDGNPNSTPVPPAHGSDVGKSQGERSTPKKA